MEKSAGKFGISGNALKILACVSMLIDHIGVFLLPQVSLLRIIGRLAFPIFSFMIYEGCRYTKSKLRYLCGMLIIGAVTSVACSISYGFLYLTVPITFSCSIVLIYLFDVLLSAKGVGDRALVCISLALAIVAMALLSLNVHVEFGLSGMLLPLFPTVAHAIFKDKRTPYIFNSAFFAFAAALIIHAIIRRDYQTFAPLALVFLAFYNGERGMKIPKYTFYIFYPVHILVLYLVSLLPIFTQ